VERLVGQAFDGTGALADRVLRPREGEFFQRLPSLSLFITRPLRRFSHDSYVVLFTYNEKSIPRRISRSILLISSRGIPETSDQVLFVYVLLEYRVRTSIQGDE
jgi:hypothetical protein